MRVLIISDIHANLEALEACLAAAPPHDIVVNLGDLVGYGASPNEVIQRSQGLGEIFVRGNHDKAVTGLMDLKDFNPVAAIAAEWTRDQLTPESMEWLRALPQGPVDLGGVPRVQLVHGSPIDEDDYVVTVRDAVEPLLTTHARITFFGHTHLQGLFETNDVQLEAFRPAYKTVGQSEISEFPLKKELRYMVNPGSIGQPRDGDWRAAFALFDSDANVLTFCRVPYSLQSAQERILAANLPPRLATRLAMGR
ncbi:MAG TPA: metallophosphoesterase family protein [Candidatus Methylacidiphilales bacterium]|nr:metallophosphoesterase family protein [Candidatus Methylacidiphilales bacterium]